MLGILGDENILDAHFGENEIKKHMPRIIAVMPNYKTDSTLFCDIAILPQGFEGNISCRSAISYGLNPKCTLTYSSLNEGQISLQRDVYRYDGKKISRRDYKGKITPYCERSLCIEAINLVLGIKN